MDLPTLEHKDYTIGWICDQGLEITTARAILDEEHADLPQSSSDTNDYTLGRISGHNVVIVGLPSEEPWTTSAAIAVTQMSFTFQNVRHRLVVGCGSGAPNEKNDIRLGDVVVSSPGGIVQWDLGKFVTSQRFVRRTDLFQKPPTSWRNAVAKLRSTLELANLDISQHLTQLAKTNSKFPKYCVAPPDEDDKLFRADYHHVDYHNTGHPTCVGCDQSMIVQRDKRGSFGPVVHYGLVATGGSLIRDTLTRDRLSYELGYPFCYDTNSSGLVNNFPCICILGISNYADSHTNAWYKGTAAAMAAIYARELLGFVPAKYDQDVVESAVVKARLKEFEQIEKQLQRLQNHIHTASPDQIQGLLDGSGGALRTTASQQTPIENCRVTLQEAFCLYGDDEVPINNERKQQSAKWFELLNNVHARVDRERLRGQRVRIAILDTGVELSDEQKDIYAKDEAMRYKSWINEDESEIVNGRDEVGHGTHLATLLARVAPNATIHVARVFKNRKVNMCTEPKNVARAIRYAIDKWNIDVIVMSFGLEQEQDSDSEGDSILKAIRYASQKGVTMFAAASNDGNNRPDGVAWPARTTEVICVHSGTGYGEKSYFTPGPHDNQRIMVLGDHVKSAWPVRMNAPANMRYMNGTSCAAPIAAGIAAIVLDYARKFLREEEWLRLRRVECMRRIFNRMKYERIHDYWWIQPWGFFALDNSPEWIESEIRKAIKSH